MTLIRTDLKKTLIKDSSQLSGNPFWYHCFFNLLQPQISKGNFLCKTNSPYNLASLFVLQSNSSPFSSTEAKLGMILHLEQFVPLLNTKPLLHGKKSSDILSREKATVMWKCGSSHDGCYSKEMIELKGFAPSVRTRLKPLCGDVSSSGFTLLSAEIELRE